MNIDALGVSLVIKKASSYIISSNLSLPINPLTCLIFLDHAMEIVGEEEIPIDSQMDFHVFI